MSTISHENSASATRAVNLRIREDVRDLIDQAAQARGRTRSDFMIEAARLAAEDTLLDQTFIQVDAQTYMQFLTLLDQSPNHEGYDRLMNAIASWKD